MERREEKTAGGDGKWDEEHRCGKAKDSCRRIAPGFDQGHNGPKPKRGKKKAKREPNPRVP